MGNFDKSNEKVVLLLDRYNQDAQRLHTSFKLSGINHIAIVIEDDGFLPDDVVSIYSAYLGDFKNHQNSFGRARYFNEIEVPDYWDISSSNQSGSVTNLEVEKARIYFANTSKKRLVSIVDWLDANGKVRICEHYNKYGAIYAKTALNANGQKVNKAFFDVNGKEVIVENYVTNDIILNLGAEIKIYRNKTDFAADCIRNMGLEDNCICYNSLSTPLFISNALKPAKDNDILFWQENERADVPGNMLSILNGTSPRTGKILVQKTNAFNKLMELTANNSRLSKAGFVYDYKRNNEYRKSVLICTNSDNIEKLNDVVELLPDVQINIAAITEMSSKLMAFDRYRNVKLYPCVKKNVQEKLFSECDIYLDINHENEINDALNMAFLNNQLILGFSNTLHNTNLIADEHIFNPGDCNKLVDYINACLADVTLMDKGIELQKAKAVSEKAETFVSAIIS